MPHLDEHERIARAHAAALSRGARVKADREENDARIREQIECDAPTHITDDDDLIDQRRAAFEDWARSKLSDEELHPEQTNNEQEDTWT